MIRLSQERTRTLLAIHGWSGVLLGLLLYAVMLTGVVAVFAEEIGDWSSPLEDQPVSAFPAGLGATLQELSRTADARYLEEVTLFPRAGGVIQAFFHHHVTPPGASQPEAFGVRFDLHPATLAVLDRRQGFDQRIDAHDRRNALADFLVELHVSLHIPDPWGYLVTGILGLAMMVAVVTGLLVHRHLLRDLFTLRRFREALLARRDAHVLAGTWNLPFAFVLAFTGSFFSFASSVGIPVMAMVAFGGDREALIETIVGLPPSEDRTPATPGDLDAMLRDAQRRANAEPAFVSISNYGRADSQVTVFTRPADGELASHNLVYAAPSGAFLRDKPGLGQVPSLGGAAADLMGPLHFGNFAGLLSKSVWFALGLASAYVALTGLRLWTTRRAHVGAWDPMTCATIWMGHGLPLALAAAAIGFFVGRWHGLVELEVPMAAAFVGSSLAAALACAVLGPERLQRVLLLATGLALLALPLLRWVTGGPGWLLAWDRGLTTILWFDFALLAGGALWVRAGSQATTITSAPRDASDTTMETTA